MAKRGNPNLKKQTENITAPVVEKEIEIKQDILEVENNTKIEEDIKWQPDSSRIICIKNISSGGLVYKSKRQLGYTITWDSKGDINNIELGELLSLRNTDKRFVTEPWIRIIEDDEIEILKYLNIFQYYENILGINNIADILLLDFEKFKKKFDKLPKGYKNSVVEYAADMISKGELDSIKIKKYIEDEMDTDLSMLVKSKRNIKSNSINII